MSTHISEDQKERERKRTEAIAAKEQAREKREQARKGGKGGNGKSLKDDMAAKKEAELREKKDARANRIKETEGKRAAKQAEADAAAPTQSAKCARPHAQTLPQHAEAPRRAVWPAPARAPARRPMRRGGACRYSKKEIMILYELFSECASARLPLRAPAPPEQLQTSSRPAADQTRCGARSPSPLGRYDLDGEGSISVVEFKQHFKKRNEQHQRAPLNATAAAVPPRPSTAGAPRGGAGSGSAALAPRLLLRVHTAPCSAQDTTARARTLRSGAPRARASTSPRLWSLCSWPSTRTRSGAAPPPPAPPSSISILHRHRLPLRFILRLHVPHHRHHRHRHRTATSAAATHFHHRHRQHPHRHLTPFFGQSGSVTFLELVKLLYPQANEQDMRTFKEWVFPDKPVQKINYVLSAEQKAELKDMFRIIDTDRSGEVTVEARDAPPTFHPDPPSISSSPTTATTAAASVPQELKAMFSGSALTGETGIDSDELNAFFAEADFDNSNAINLAEFEKLMISTGLYVPEIVESG